MKTLSLPSLYPITDARLDVALSGQIRRFGEAGFPLVQFRGKPLNAKAQWQELQLALQTSHDCGGWPLIAVNDRADLAVLAAQEGLAPWGLHLGQEDLPPSEARRLPGLEALHIGTSTHGEEEWTAPNPACDHAGVGPVRGTATKADHAAPIGFDGLRDGCLALKTRGVAPIAIGGLAPTDFEACFEAGASSVALVSALATAAVPAELLWQAQVARWKAQPPLIKNQGVVLVGSSGAGKSTLGPALAARLDLPFVDLDPLIERAEGQSIASIFSKGGEAAFRELETIHAEKALGTPCVLSLGGGAWEVEGVREAVGRSGFSSLWLAERPDLCWERVAGDSTRPLATTRETFMARHRVRIRRWSELPPVLPLGRSPNHIAEGLISAIS